MKKRVGVWSSRHQPAVSHLPARQSPVAGEKSGECRDQVRQVTSVPISKMFTQRLMLFLPNPEPGNNRCCLCVLQAFCRWNLVCATCNGTLYFSYESHRRLTETSVANMEHSTTERAAEIRGSVHVHGIFY